MEEVYEIRFKQPKYFNPSLRRCVPEKPENCSRDTEKT